MCGDNRHVYCPRIHMCVTTDATTMGATSPKSVIIPDPYIAITRTAPLLWDFRASSTRRLGTTRERQRATHGDKERQATDSLTRLLYMTHLAATTHATPFANGRDRAPPYR